MFVVVNRMRVKPARRQTFFVCWRTAAEIIQERCGGTGSRLHVTEDGDYVEYQQWPDRETWKACEPPPELHDVLQRMRESCDVWERVYAMEVAEDLVPSAP
jgi:heme-degrading monooxygenase HmoA